MESVWQDFDTKNLLKWLGLNNDFLNRNYRKKVQTLDNCILDRVGIEAKNYIHFERKRRLCRVSYGRKHGENSNLVDSSDVKRKEIDWLGLARATWRYWVGIDASQVHLCICWENTIHKSEHVEDSEGFFLNRPKFWQQAAWAAFSIWA